MKKITVTLTYPDDQHDYIKAALQYDFGDWCKVIDLPAMLRDAWDNGCGSAHDCKTSKQLERERDEYIEMITDTPSPLDYQVKHVDFNTEEK